MEIWQVKDRELRMTLDSLYCKKMMLADLKRFKHFDWTEVTSRLRTEIGSILLSLDDEESAIWHRIWEKKEKNRKINEELMHSLGF